MQTTQKELLSWAMKQNGISKGFEKIIDNELFRVLEKFKETESLNVTTATAIILSEFSREM
jgi:tRNA G18 (ribose-2'-O)-methylase SpoU